MRKILFVVFMCGCVTQASHDAEIRRLKEKLEISDSKLRVCHDQLDAFGDQVTSFRHKIDCVEDADSLHDAKDCL